MNGLVVFDVEGMNSLLTLRKMELKKNGSITSDQEDAVDEELVSILNYFYAENHARQFRQAKLECLRFWCRLVVVILETSQFDKPAKTAFVLQALQAIIPKLEAYSTTDIANTRELSSLA